MGSPAPLVDRLYVLVSSLPRFHYHTVVAKLPENGLYVFFEKGEISRIGDNALDRIVRVGTHRENLRFRDRIRQHYGNSRSLGGNKNGSIFRKHLGGALLRRSDTNDPRLREWLTQNGSSFPEIEELISNTLRDKFSFSCFDVDQMEERLELERGIIALLAQHPLSPPSPDWLGKYAVNEKIRRSGLWNTQHIEAKCLGFEQFYRLEELVAITLKGA